MTSFYSSVMQIFCTKPVGILNPHNRHQSTELSQFRCMRKVPKGPESRHCSCRRCPIVATEAASKHVAGERMQVPSIVADRCAN